MEAVNELTRSPGERIALLGQGGLPRSGGWFVQQNESIDHHPGAPRHPPQL